MRISVRHWRPSTWRAMTEWKYMPRRYGGVANYQQANAYLDEHYLTEHNRRYARPAAEAADYHRRRPTARQLDAVFWLEEERVVSEDWVVRYHNRLLQLERQSRHWAPARSRVWVRENEAGDLAIHYRNQRVGYRELKASTAPPSPRLRRSLPPAPNHPWRKGLPAKDRVRFSGAA